MYPVSSVFWVLKEEDWCSVCSEYVSLPLVNEEAALAYSKAEYGQAGKDIENRQSQRDAM